MKLLGKQLKEFFSGKKGVFIDEDDKMIFIDCEHGKSNVIKKPKDEEYPDYIKYVLYSDMFDVVKLLDDKKEYEIRLVFNFLILEHVDKDGKIDVEMGISGERF
jgi:Ni,Fe-hydrogenase maturation factor